MARARREEDKQRQSQQEQRRQLLQEKLLRSGRNEDVDLARLIIYAAEDPDSSIRVHDHIARSIKPHQIEGVSFMWNQIVKLDEKSMEGCLLAHTMGKLLPSFGLKCSSTNTIDQDLARLCRQLHS